MIFAPKEHDLGHVAAEYSFYLGGLIYCMTDHSWVTLQFLKLANEVNSTHMSQNVSCSPSKENWVLLTREGEWMLGRKKQGTISGGRQWIAI